MPDFQRPQHRHSEGLQMPFGKALYFTRHLRFQSAFLSKPFGECRDFIFKRVDSDFAYTLFAFRYLQVSI